MFHFNYTGQGHPLASSPSYSRRREGNCEEVMGVFTFSFSYLFNPLESKKWKKRNAYILKVKHENSCLHTVFFYVFIYPKQNPRKHKQTHIPWQTSLFQIIPSDKINATEYEVIALMGHTPLRWHSVLHTLNVTPIAYCTSRQVSHPLFFLRPWCFTVEMTDWGFTQHLPSGIVCWLECVKETLRESKGHIKRMSSYLALS